MREADTPKVQPGDLLQLGPAASSQFTAPHLFMVTAVLTDKDGREYAERWSGWVWLRGYEIADGKGRASEQREVFVKLAGCEHQAPRRGTPSPTGNNPRARGPGPGRNVRTTTSTTSTAPRNGSGNRYRRPVGPGA
jgi:hypothetical protein